MYTVSSPDVKTIQSFIHTTIGLSQFSILDLRLYIRLRLCASKFSTRLFTNILLALSDFTHTSTRL